MFKDFKFFEISNAEGASSYVVYLTENHSKHLFAQSQLEKGIKYGLRQQ